MAVGDLSLLFFATFVIIALIALSRWVFKPSRSTRRVLIPGDAVPGMLTPLSTGLRRFDGMALRAVLGDAGIRSSLSARRDGQFDVLVFTADLERATAGSWPALREALGQTTSSTSSAARSAPPPGTGT